MVELRIDARLRGRADASDVLQDAFLDAAARLDNLLRDIVPVFAARRSSGRASNTDPFAP
jgi:hypothetical protein